MQRLNVIYLHPHFTSPGGAGRAVLETGQRLAQRGHRVSCVCIRADAAIVGGAAGIEFHEIGGPLSSSLEFWWNFRSGSARVADAVDQILIRQSDLPTVLFPQVFPANWWAGGLLAARPNLHCVWYCQEPSAFIHSRDWMRALPWPKNWLARALGPLLKRSDVAICRRFPKVLVNSHFSLGRTLKAYNYASGCCEVAYLGVDSERFRVDQSLQRRPWITTIGKLTRFKNVDRILHALRLLRDRGFDQVHLQVVGEGDALASLRAKATALNLSEQVVFQGRIADEAVVRLLQQSSAFCLASVDEPFGLVCIEAMACGTPVVAVDTGGPREVVANHGCGILVPHGTPEELADALEQLLQSSSLFPTLSAGATARAADFDWGGCVDQLERILFQAAVASAR